VLLWKPKSFFSIPGPIFGLISFASANVNFGTTLSSIKSPSTFVMNNTLSLPTLPATYAAALSPSTLRNSDSSLIAIGEITGVSPCLSNDLINSEFTFLILPVYPPSIACFLPFSFTINNLFSYLLL
jgi:hypothetical protein